MYDLQEGITGSNFQQIRTLMIKTILKNSITLYLLCFIITAKAQSYAGLRGGVNFANVPTTDDYGLTNERILGVAANLFFDIEINDKIAIQPEFGFVQKGWVREAGKPFHYITRLNYLEWNVLFKYRILNINNSPKKKKNVNAYFLAGPYFARAVSGKEINTVLETTESFFLYSSYVKRGDAGLIGGAGVELPLFATGNLIVELRYNYGLLRIEDWGRPGTIKNRGILIGVGYILRLGR